MLKVTAPNGRPINLRFPTSIQEFPKYVTTADPPIPPNWNELCNNTIPTLPCKTVYKFPLAPGSVEYQTLAWMIQPSCNVRITGIEQIVNEELWNKFIFHRKETMLSKCRDATILSGFNLPEQELARIVRNNANRDRNIGTKLHKNSEYSDNTCLLFHCTKGDPEAIFKEGLDERLGNGGLLGRGIYFSDNPLKSMGYDLTGGTLLIFMVSLGDCVERAGVNFNNYAHNSTREPPKLPYQSRTNRDRTFDSIARGGYQNEFVIYNRYQCVPVFSVKYSRRTSHTTPHYYSVTTTGVKRDLFHGLRQSLPEFVWKRKGNWTIPGESTKLSPLHAKTIFDLMKSFNEKIQAIKKPSQVVGSTDLSVPKRLMTNDKEEAQEKLAIGLSQLLEIGFTDDALNSKLLKKHDHNLEIVIMELINKNSTSSSTQTNGTSPSSSHQGRRGEKRRRVVYCR